MLRYFINLGPRLGVLRQPRECDTDAAIATGEKRRPRCSSTGARVILSRDCVWGSGG